MKNKNGEYIEVANKPKEKIFINIDYPLEEGDMVRRIIEEKPQD